MNGLALRRLSQVTEILINFYMPAQMNSQIVMKSLTP